MGEKTVIFLHGQPVMATRLYLKGLAAFAAKRRWRVQCNIAPKKAGMDYLRRMVDFWDPVGIVCDFCTCRNIPHAFAKTPIVYIDSDPAKRERMTAQKSGRAAPVVGFVDANPAAIVRIAADELLRRDFTSYAFVSSWQRWHWSDRRLEAFRKVMSRNGKETLAFTGVNLQTGDSAYVRRIGKWLKTLPKPCGLLAANDRMASLVLAAAAREEIPVPDGVGIIGIDNDEILCESLSPPIASVEVDFAGGGALAGQLAADLADGKAKSGTTLLYGAKRFVPRLSLRRLNRQTPSVGNALETIRRSAAEGLSAADVLKLLGGSRRSAEKRFKAATGKSVLDEIMDVRFEKVLAMLGRNSIPLGLIADAAGFTSPNQLQRQFKARYGTTLSAYRKRLLKS